MGLWYGTKAQSRWSAAWCCSMRLCLTRGALLPLSSNQCNFLSMIQMHSMRTRQYSSISNAGIHKHLQGCAWHWFLRRTNKSTMSHVLVMKPRENHLLVLWRHLNWGCWNGWSREAFLHAGLVHRAHDHWYCALLGCLQSMGSALGETPSAASPWKHKSPKIAATDYMTAAVQAPAAQRTFWGAYGFGDRGTDTECVVRTEDC